MFTETYVAKIYCIPCNKFVKATELYKTKTCSKGCSRIKMHESGVFLYGECDLLYYDNPIEEGFYSITQVDDKHDLIALTSPDGSDEPKISKYLASRPVLSIECKMCLTKLETTQPRKKYCDAVCRVNYHKAEASRKIAEKANCGQVGERNLISDILRGSLPTIQTN